MSRHSLHPLAGLTAVYEVAIGWDRALATYFVIVFGVPDHGEDDDGSGLEHELVPLLWEGTRRAALATPEAAVEIAACHAAIPDGLAAQLAADRSNESTSVNEPAQSTLLTTFLPQAEAKPGRLT